MGGMIEEHLWVRLSATNLREQIALRNKILSSMVGERNKARLLKEIQKLEEILESQRI